MRHLLLGLLRDEPERPHASVQRDLDVRLVVVDQQRGVPRDHQARVQTLQLLGRRGQELLFAVP